MANEYCHLTLSLILDPDTGLSRLQALFRRACIIVVELASVENKDLQSIVSLIPRGWLLVRNRYE